MIGFTILRIGIDALATVFASVIAFIILMILRQNDFLSEHAGRPLSGMDPARVFVLIAWVVLLVGIWW